MPQYIICRYASSLEQESSPYQNYNKRRREREDSEFLRKYVISSLLRGYKLDLELLNFDTSNIFAVFCSFQHTFLRQSLIIYIIVSAPHCLPISVPLELLARFHYTTTVYHCALSYTSSSGLVGSPLTVEFGRVKAVNVH